MKHLSLIVVILVLLSCNGDSKKQKEMIVGNWHGTAWLVEGKPSSNDFNAVKFGFTADGDYTSILGAKNSKGTYRISDSKLYTTEEGQAEIAVGINKLTSDSLVFDMNRGGQQEQLFLKKD